MRTYRPVAETFTVWVPPVPAVVEKTVVQVELSLETWIWNALAYAGSQARVTWQIVETEPKSTSSHCGSDHALDQRVDRLPSVAFDAGNEALCTDDAIVG